MMPDNWQALLFVPSGVSRFIKGAIKHRPDTVILDLEDGVSAEAKAGARDTLKDNQAELSQAGLPSIVRVNAPLATMIRDIEAIDLARTAAVMIPKSMDARPLINAADLLAGQEQTLGIAPIPLIALVESPTALGQLDDIAGAPRVAALMFGSEDYSAELGTPADSPALEIAAALLTAACVKRRLMPIGLAGPIGNFKDLAVYRTRVERARLLGFRAAAAIHPDQLPVLRTGFQPTEGEVIRAQEIVAAFESNSQGAIALEGSMLDAPIVERARRVLSLAAASKAP